MEVIESHRAGGGGAKYHLRAPPPFLPWTTNKNWLPLFWSKSPPPFPFDDLPTPLNYGRIIITNRYQSWRERSIGKDVEYLYNYIWIQIQTYPFEGTQFFDRLENCLIGESEQDQRATT